MEWREANGLRWLEAELPGARAVFSTRVGGVSEPPFDTLNLGLLTGDEPASVRENRLRLAAAVGIDPHGVLIGRQVHAAEIATHSERQDADAFANPGPGPARMVFLVSPSGHEHYQKELAELVASATGPLDDAIAELRARHDIEQPTPPVLGRKGVREKLELLHCID